MARIHLLNQTKETIVATYSNSLTCGRFINSNHNMYNEGKLLQFLLDIVNGKSGRTLTQSKEELCQYDHFFDGSIQRDALECFNLLLDIIHKGQEKLG